MILLTCYWILVPEFFEDFFHLYSSGIWCALFFFVVFCLASVSGLCQSHKIISVLFNSFRVVLKDLCSLFFKCFIQLTNEFIQFSALLWVVLVTYLISILAMSFSDFLFLSRLDLVVFMSLGMYPFHLGFVLLVYNCSQ